MSDPFFSKVTRDRWFFAFFLLTMVALGMLFSPYVYALLFSTVVAVVSWPLFRLIESKLNGRRTIAAILTLISLFFLVFGPLTLIGWLFVSEASSVVRTASQFMEGNQFDILVDTYSQQTPPPVHEAREWLAGWVPEGWLPDEGSMFPAFVDWVRTSALALLSQAGAGLPGILEGFFGFGLDAVIFLFALFTLYLEGPRLLTALMHLSPMDDRYERQLFDVFRELANNMVLATLITAVIQGCIAAIGFRIAGLPSVAFLGILAGVCSFIPLAGTGIIWIPAAIVVGFMHGWSWAVFLAIWNLVFTGSVDNVIKPLVLRGSTRIHPLLIFLSVFGGLAWFGPVGVLMGPLIVAFFLAAYTIYMREYLDMEVALPDKKDDAFLPAWLTRWLPFLRPVKAKKTNTPGEVARLPDADLPKRQKSKTPKRPKTPKTPKPASDQ